MSQPQVQLANDKALITALQSLLADSIMLFMNYKYYLWKTGELRLVDLRDRLEEFSRQVMTTVDALSRQISAMGEQPATDFQHINNLSRIAFAKQHHCLRHMLAQAEQHTINIIMELHYTSRFAHNRGDGHTQSVLNDIMKIHEEQAWWLRETLTKNESLPTFGTSVAQA